MLIRSWNVFHGRTVPSGQRRYFERMARLIVEGEPAVVGLQELAVWALPRLERWTGYRAFGAVAARPLLPSAIAGAVTDLDPNLIRSAVEGQANALLVRRDLPAVELGVLALNPRKVRRRVAARLGLGLHARLSWARERRVVQAVRVELGGRAAVVANLHATSYRHDKRIADAELLRAASFADGLARPGEPIVLAGDFNVTVVTSPTLRALATPEWGFSQAEAGLDHVLVRGLATAGPEQHWPEPRRLHEGVLLSDHAPVELELA